MYFLQSMFQTMEGLYQNHRGCQAWIVPIRETVCFFRGNNPMCRSLQDFPLLFVSVENSNNNNWN